MPEIKGPRSSPVKVMLHPDVHANLRLIADRLGQTPSTVASVYLSEIVAQKVALLGVQDKALTAVMQLLGPQLQQAMQGDLDLVESGGDPARGEAPKRPGRKALQ
jgi:hypothetical protein